MTRSRLHVALVGMAGVGKTSVGRRLARSLRAIWVDLDSLVELRAGCSVEEMFAEVGEQGFRAAEADALAAALSESAAHVISTGGGAVLADGTADLLRRHAVTVWLRASDDTIVDRIRRSATVRPLLVDDPVGAVARLNRERAGAYERCADVIVDVDGLDIGEVVRRVLAELDSYRVTEPGAQTPLPAS